MSQLNDSVSELANFWDGLLRNDDNLVSKLEGVLGKDDTEQLSAYIQELENYNDEIDMDSIISDMEEARYQLDSLESTVRDAMTALDDAVSNAEDLR
jgi:tetrahydromethanopterin S-methyltransferase subunit B